MTFFLHVYSPKLNYKEKAKIIEYGLFNYHFCISIKQEEASSLGYTDVMCIVDALWVGQFDRLIFLLTSNVIRLLNAMPP